VHRRFLMLRETHICLDFRYWAEKTAKETYGLLVMALGDVFSG